DSVPTAANPEACWVSAPARPRSVTEKRACPPQSTGKQEPCFWTEQYSFLYHLVFEMIGTWPGTGEWFGRLQNTGLLRRAHDVLLQAFRRFYQPAQAAAGKRVFPAADRDDRLLLWEEWNLRKNKSFRIPNPESEQHNPMCNYVSTLKKRISLRLRCFFSACLALVEWEANQVSSACSNSCV